MDRRRLLLLAVVVLLAAAVGGWLAYDNVLRGDDVAPLALPSASAAAGPSGTASPDAPADGDPDELAGTWMVVEGSSAGYRVRERLANLSADSDAVGRTNLVAGSIELADAGEGLRLTAATLVVDMASLVSDESRRDDRLRTEGLQTGAYPEASFVLASEVDLPAAARDGSAVSVVLAGDLTLHGVTRTVEIPTEARLVDGRIQVAGALTIVLADFDITPPNVGGFILSIADEGALEFLVVLARAG